MTREQYHALVNRRKKRRPRRKKGEADPVKHVYQSIEGVQLELKGHAPELDKSHDSFSRYTDEIMIQQQKEIDENGYHGDW